MIILYTLLAASLAALGVSHARADPVSDARSAIMAGKYERAVNLLHPAAARGDATAQYVLGNMYRNGWGLQEDARSAALWYQSSAEQGNTDAQHSLGELYYVGRGVPKSYEKAVHWFYRAATDGKSAAPAPQYVLGVMFQKGEGVNQDLVSAYMWFSIASINAIATETQKEYTKSMETVGKSMTSSQVQTARDRTRECLSSNYAKC